MFILAIHAGNHPSLAALRSGLAREPYVEFMVVISAMAGPPMINRGYSFPNIFFAARVKGLPATSSMGSTPQLAIATVTYRTSITPVDMRIASGISLVGFLASLLKFITMYWP